MKQIISGLLFSKELRLTCVRLSDQAASDLSCQVCLCKVSSNSPNGNKTNFMFVLGKIWEKSVFLPEGNNDKKYMY